jgi:hypothetical protein
MRYAIATLAALLLAGCGSAPARQTVTPGKIDARVTEAREGPRKQHLRLRVVAPDDRDRGGTLVIFSPPAEGEE